MFGACMFACMCGGEWHLEQVAKVRRRGEGDVIRAQVRPLVGVGVRFRVKVRVRVRVKVRLGVVFVLVLGG